MEYGIDVSHYNAISSADAVRAAGISFAWCKATQGTGGVDATFAAKVKQLRAAGIVVGAYHYLTAGNVAAQAAHFRQVAGAAGCLSATSLAPMLDCEDSAAAVGINPAVVAFYDALGAPLLDVYGNLGWWTHWLLPGTWGAVRHLVGHIARYNGQPGQPGWSYPDLAVHQHTDAGLVDGIPGHVDRDATMPGWELSRLVLGHTVPPPSSSPAVPVPPGATGDVWVVRAGDTLSRIASYWHVTVSGLAAANGIPNPDAITLGQFIHRPGTGAAVALPPASASGAQYVVQAGDTVTGIAAREHTTEAVLVALNHLANPDRIVPGQRLTLPAPSKAGVGSGNRTYVVRAGDTLGTIAARLGYPGGWPALAAHNHLSDPNKITTGEHLQY